MTPRLFTALLACLFLGLSGCDGNELAGVQNLDGKPIDPTHHGDARVTVLLFIDSDCPVSNRYAPEIQRLHADYAPRGVNFWLVYPDPDISVASIRAHMQDYGYTLPALRDPEHALVRRARALVTPEAGIFLSDGTLVYHGRIDDRYVDLSRRRPQPTERDLVKVLDTVLAGKTVDTAWTPAPGRSLEAMSQPGVGCYIRDFK
jgi:hypothetical protein